MRDGSLLTGVGRICATLPACNPETTVVDVAELGAADAPASCCCCCCCSRWISLGRFGPLNVS